MIQAIWEQVQSLLALGRYVGDVGAVAMALRTVVLYAFTLVIVRMGSTRLLGRASAFDVIAVSVQDGVQSVRIEIG